MDRSRLLVCLVAVVSLGLSASACEEKKKDEGAKKPGEEATTAAETPTGDEAPAPETAAPAETAAAAGGDADAAEPAAAADTAPPAEPPPAEAPAMLSPATVDPNVPLSPKALHDAYFGLDGKEVVFAGHPAFIFREDALNRPTAFNATPGDKETKLVSCKNFKTPDEEKFAPTKVAVIHGTMEPRSGFPYIQLKDCTKLALVDALPAETTLPGTAEAPMPITQLYQEAWTGWDGKEVSVQGIFNGSTTSTPTGGKSTTRLDIMPVGGGDKLVACDEFPAPPGPELNGVTVVVRGVVAGTMFNEVRLSGCHIVEE